MADTATHWQILNAVRQALVDLALDGIPEKQIYLRKAPYDQDVQQPALIVWPGGSEVLEGPASTFKIRERGYPAAVTFVPANAKSPQLTEPEMAWRQAVILRFERGPNLSADGNQWVARVEPGPVVDPDLWIKTGWFMGSVGLRFWGMQ